MEATEARVTAHPGGKHEARRYQLLSLRIKVAQIRAMEKELVRFLADSAGKAAPEKVTKPRKTGRPRRRSLEIASRPA